MTEARKPLRSDHRRYMRSSISAQSCDSVPPAPGFTVRIAFSRSLSPESRVSVSSCATYSSAASSSFSTSRKTESRWPTSLSSCARCKYLSMSLEIRESFSSAAMLLSAFLRCCRTCCAVSWSCQKSGCEVRFSRSARRLRLRSTSKIAPHELDAFVQFLKPVFEIFDDHLSSLSSDYLTRHYCRSAAERREEQQNRADDKADYRQPIAPARIETRVAAKSVPGIQFPTNVRSHSRNDSSVWVDRYRVAIVRIAQKPAPEFHRAHPCHR